MPLLVGLSQLTHLQWLCSSAPISGRFHNPQCPPQGCGAAGEGASRGKPHFSQARSPPASSHLRSSRSDSGRADPFPGARRRIRPPPWCMGHSWTSSWGQPGPGQHGAGGGSEPCTSGASGANTCLARAGPVAAVPLGVRSRAAPWLCCAPPCWPRMLLFGFLAGWVSPVHPEIHFWAVFLRSHCCGVMGSGSAGSPGVDASTQPAGTLWCCSPGAPSPRP